MKPQTKGLKTPGAVRAQINSFEDRPEAEGLNRPHF